ncbi:MAG TPA: hypothetical protein VFV90_08030, partial [Usitatibacter sp.]|nr:hypothetical protein [Usitatibacter sp.]
MQDSGRIIGHMVESIGRADESTEPFHHLHLDGVFPREVYSAMTAHLPAAAMYRPMSGRAREAQRPDGTPTRTKMHLLPEFIRRMPPRQREVWAPVGEVLCSALVREAFVRRLAVGLEKRFGAIYGRVDMCALPILTRDVAGYKIGVHPDTRHKGIT